MLDQQETIYTVPEVAEHLYVGKNTIYNLLRSGDLVGFRIGRSWLISKESLDNFIKSKSERKR